jgi:hypothetical protein
VLPDRSLQWNDVVIGRGGYFHPLQHRQRSVLIGCRVQKPFLKDLDTYRKPLKLSRPAAFLKLATEHLAGLKEPAEKMWEGAVEQMFPAPGGVKGGD